MKNAIKKQNDDLSENIDDSDEDFARQIMEIAEEVTILDIKELEKSNVKRMFKDEMGWFGETQNNIPDGQEIIKDEWDMGRVIGISHK